MPYFIPTVFQAVSLVSGVKLSPRDIRFVASNPVEICYFFIFCRDVKIPSIILYEKIQVLGP